MTILEEICNQQRKDVDLQKKIIPIDQLKRYNLFKKTERLSMKKSILDPNKTGVIAEYKRKSPSKGVINDANSATEMAMAYEQGGASAISILTNQKYFDGSIEYVFEAKKSTSLPVLRKEFIVDEYQIVEAEVIGADAILLICEVLTKEEIKNFTACAHDLGLEVLLELHSQDQVEKIPAEVDMVGVNNRDLHTFEVDFERSIALLEDLPTNAVKIAESGIRTTEEMIYLYEAGFDGFLIGETFMKQDNPPQFSTHYLNQYSQLRKSATKSEANG